MIKNKGRTYDVPRYSLTGDLLSYLECGVQYRFNSKGSMPPSTPVQKWFGNFIHGVMEVGFTKWKEGELNINNISFDDAQEIALIVAERLEIRGLKPYAGLYLKKDTKERKRTSCVANQVAFCSLYYFARHLFPLINDNEVKLGEVRSLTGYDENRTTSDRYGVQGVVDVISTFDVDKCRLNNPLVKALMLDPVVNQNISSENEYEIIIDYKGMVRPATNSDVWTYHEWQIYTYMWLRAQQLKSEGKKTPILAGVLLYLNELYPSKDSMKDLLEQTESHTTDLIPNEDDVRRLRNGNPCKDNFRIMRCIRVIAYDESKIQASLKKFDEVVQNIESSIISEMSDSKNVWKHWKGDFNQARCTACDFKTFCPYAEKGNFTVHVP